MRMGVLVCRRGLILLVLQLFISLNAAHNLRGRTMLEEKPQADVPGSGLHLLQKNQHVVMSNGIVSLTLTTPDGHITNITHKGSDNLLEIKFPENDRGYWDVVWNKTAGSETLDKLPGTSFKVIVQNENQIEISFTTTWAVGSKAVPLSVDKRFIMLRDSPGFYTYAVFERLEGWPAYDIQEGRIALKLQQDKFDYMAVSNERQRFMPTRDDRSAGQVLDYKEAVLLTNPKNPQFKGEVDDKYLYSCDNKDNKVHGWISTVSEPPVGLWMITPSNEFRTGGPFKQDLTSHLGPIVLSMFISTHYAGRELALKFKSEEHWKKVLGPVFIYLNSNVSAKTNPSILWDDAKNRMLMEVNSWPYNFPISKDFVKSNQRGSVRGQLLVHDRSINEKPVPAASAYVGLAKPGNDGSWQTESKGYQFWTQTDGNGNFLIKNVRPGNYSLFAWVPGYIGDYKHAFDLSITPGSIVNVNNVVFTPPRNGPTLWEIGIPDRTAAEFFIPDPSPSFKIHQYKDPVDKFRQYGLWRRYKDFYPTKDLIFTVGQSDYKKDWFFAQVTREVGNGQHSGTTWQIVFDLKNVRKAANYTLQLALASDNQATLQVHFNDPKSAPIFTTKLIGEDNALARHGIKGLYHLYSIVVPGNHLVEGTNTIFLKQIRNEGLFREVMYDYIRFEGPAA